MLIQLKATQDYSSDIYVFHLQYDITKTKKSWEYRFAIQALTVNMAYINSLSFIVINDVIYGSLD